MYRSVISARIKNGKIPEAIPAAKAIADYVNEKYHQKVDLFLRQFGPIGMIHWTSEYKDLDTFQKLNEQIMADQGYWAAVNKASEMLIEGSVESILLKSV